MRELYNPEKAVSHPGCHFTSRASPHDAILQAGSDSTTCMGAHADFTSCGTALQPGNTEWRPGRRITSGHGLYNPYTRVITFYKLWDDRTTRGTPRRAREGVLQAARGCTSHASPYDAILQGDMRYTTAHTYMRILQAAGG